MDAAIQFHSLDHRILSVPSALRPLCPLCNFFFLFPLPRRDAPETAIGERRDV